MNARDYHRGLRSQAEVARELGVSVRTLQRIEDEAVARWLLAIARAMRASIGYFSSEPRLPRRFACRISENQVEHDDVARDASVAHAEAPAFPLPGATSRARQLPRRFPPRTK